MKSVNCHIVPRPPKTPQPQGGGATYTRGSSGIEKLAPSAHYKGIIYRHHEHKTCILQIGVLDVAGNMLLRAPRTWCVPVVSTCTHRVQQQSNRTVEKANVLKAPGTPMIRPSPVANSLARLTVFPGDFSVRTSKFGMVSPTLTKAGRVEWKPLEAATLDRAARANGRREDLNAMVVVRSDEH